MNSPRLVALCFAFLASACAVATHAPKVLGPAELTGKLWARGSGQLGDRQALLSRAVEARFLLLGEIHDSEEAHAEQAEWLRAVVKTGRRPVLVFEMLEPGDEEKVQAFAEKKGGNIASLGEDLGWAKRGWPSWSMYAPIFEIALAAGLEVRSGNLPTALAKQVAKGKADAETANRLDHQSRLPEKDEADLRAELKADHCGQIGDEVAIRMSIVQRARDTRMAAVMGEAKGGAVLIAGAGHTRRDRGVPWHLRQSAEDGAIFSLGARPVDGEHLPKRNAQGVLDGEELPFDAVLFVPATKGSFVDCKE